MRVTLCSQRKRCMYITIRWCVILWIASTSIGCATAFGPKFRPIKPSQNKAIAYVYRMPSLSGSMLSATPAVLLDGERVGTLKNGGYVPIEMSPGKHIVTLQNTLFGRARGNDIGKIELEVVEGEARYFEFMQITTDYDRYGETEVAQVRFHFFEVPEKLALKKLQRTRLSD